MDKYINQIIHADCLDVMMQLPDNSIDLLLTDPPYGIGKSWMKQKNTYHYGAGIDMDWNDNRINKKYFDEIFRISKNQIIFGANYYTDFLPITNSWIVWDKGRNVEKTFMSECEVAWTSFQIPMRKIFVQWDGPKKQGETGKKNIHPYQRPILLYTWCLSKYSKENDLILDCFSGSGSVAVAAHRMNRRFICIEKELKYVELSQKRLEEERLQVVMNI